MENEENLKNKNVETYVADMARVVDGQEGIYIKKIIEDQEKNKEKNTSLSISNIKNKIFILVGLFLIFASIGALGYMEFSKKKIFRVNVIQELTPIIYLDNSVFKEVADLSKEQIFQSMANEIFSSEVKQGGVLGIYLTENKKNIGLRNFLTIISANVDQKEMSFVDDNFLIGAANLDKKYQFILLKVRSFSDVFDVMHSWEDKMFYDLHSFFNIDLSSTTNYLVTKDFEDAIVQNKNARILKDSEEKIVLMYIFINETSLIITNSDLAAREIGLRLSSGILKK